MSSKGSVGQKYTQPENRSGKGVCCALDAVVEQSGSVSFPGCGDDLRAFIVGRASMLPPETGSPCRSRGWAAPCSWCPLWGRSMPSYSSCRSIWVRRGAGPRPRAGTTSRDKRRPARACFASVSSWMRELPASRGESTDSAQG